jgi:hypothetical protein
MKKTNLELRFGHPDSYDFDTILDQFSGTKINSFRTSSIPLVQFWKKTDRRLKELFCEIDLECDNPILCFEYPTKPKKGRGKSSMTDLMILGNDFKIAVEAKFTEYVKMKSNPISLWKTKTDNIENKQRVLDYWTNLIKPFSKGLDDLLLQQIDYQFFHRTASACKETENAIVIYQLFYDRHTLKDLERFKNELGKYIEIINPNDNLSFYIWEIEVNQIIKESKDIDDPFIEMKSRNVFEFMKTKFERI